MIYITGDIHGQVKDVRTTININNNIKTASALLILENDLVHDKEDHHGDTAVHDGGADAVEPVQSGGQQVLHNVHPHAVDGVDHAGDHAESQQVPHTLVQDVAFGAEHEAALDEEVDHFAHEHGHHVSSEVRQATGFRAVTDDVPLEGNAEQLHLDAGKTEVRGTQESKDCGQEHQGDSLAEGNHIGNDNEQATLADQLSDLRVVFSP